MRIIILDRVNNRRLIVHIGPTYNHAIGDTIRLADSEWKVIDRIWDYSKSENDPILWIHVILINMD